MASESALDHYEKGETVIIEGDVHEQFTDLPENVVMINVKPGSKMRNIIGFSLRAIKEEQKRQFVVSGSGAGIYKAISCTQVIKQKIKGLYQITRISYLRLEEPWNPKENPELDPLKVTREIPQIHMLLSKDPLNPSELGYQPPGNYNPREGRSSQQKRKSKQQRFQEQYNQKLKSEAAESTK